MTDDMRLFDVYANQAGTAFRYHADVRTSDPATSHAAAKRARPRAGSQKAVLLAVFAANGDLTAYEAGQLSGLARKPGCCYWHRVGDLARDGLLEDTGLTRIVATGEGQRVYRITAAGMAALA